MPISTKNGMYQQMLVKLRSIKFNKIRSAALELLHVGRRRVVGKAHFRTLIANFLK